MRWSGKQFPVASTPGGLPREDASIAYCAPGEICNGAPGLPPLFTGTFCARLSFPGTVLRVYGPHSRIVARPRTIAACFCLRCHDVDGGIEVAEFTTTMHAHLRTSIEPVQLMPSSPAIALFYAGTSI